MLGSDVNGAGIEIAFVEPKFLDTIIWGYAMGATVLRTRDGKLDAADEKAFADLLKRIATGKPKILIHLHGGLVDQKSGEDIATRLSGQGERSYGNPEGWEQVYIVWRTGALETLRTNWKDLAENDRLYNVILRKLIQYLSTKIRPPGFGSRSIGQQKGLTADEIDTRLATKQDAPFSDLDAVVFDVATGRSIASADNGAEAELLVELEDDTDIEDVANDIEAAVSQAHPISARAGMTGNAESGKAILSRLDNRIEADLSVEATYASARGDVITGKILIKIVKLIAKIGNRVIDRYRNRRDHGLHATIVEEIARELYGDLIGSVIWGMMKSDAGDHFVEHGLGRRLLEAIGANPETQVVTVAHSAGAIFASELLIWAAKKGVAFTTDLIFLAPAVRTAKFAEVLELSEDRIAEFRMFTMTDKLERADCLLGSELGFIYPSSLLYLVSGLFEQVEAEGLVDSPLLGMQRFLSDECVWLQDEREGPALARVQGFLFSGSNRVVFSEAAGGVGLNCDAKSHGEFDNNSKTLESVATFFG